MILASLSGIQDYLFAVRESGGHQARSLRYRSFYIQLTAECIALRLLDAAGLGPDRLLFCAAGKACIEAAQLGGEKVEGVKRAAAEMRQRLIEDTHGRLRLTVVLSEIDAGGNFGAAFQQASRCLAAEKLRPFAPIRFGATGGWDHALLIGSEPWDPSEEAERDAALGRALVDARWLVIRAPQASHERSGLEIAGLQVGFWAREPVPADGLLSCSNLAEPLTPPRSIGTEIFRPRRLARHVPRHLDGNIVEFIELARAARGAAMLGVLKADVDSLGEAIGVALRETGGPVALTSLSDSLDSFFSETLDAEKRKAGSPWADVYTIFSGGDDMLAVGPWDGMIDFAVHVRNMFIARFGAGAAGRASPQPLTISAGIALIKPRYPIHLAARQADDLLDTAKKAPPKDSCAAFGDVWRWEDHGQIVSMGKQLAEWVDCGIIVRGWLQTLLELTLLRRGQAGGAYAGTSAAVATSRVAYHVARNWPRKTTQPRDDADRAGNAARQWMDEVKDHFDDDPCGASARLRYLPTILRYAILATRSADGDER